MPIVVRLGLICFVAGLLLGGGHAGVAAADDGPRTTAKPRALLKKATLGPWKEVAFGGQGVVEVVDGVLTLGAGDPITAVKWAGAVGDAPGAFPKSNYKLSFEARRTLGLDFFATVTFPVDDDTCSLVVGGWGGGLTGLSSLNGSDASENSTNGFTAFENDKWYAFDLIVTDEQILALQNGKPMFDPVAIDDYEIDIRIEMEPCQPLGIASYLCTGEIRNLTVTRLEKGAGVLPELAPNAASD